MLSPMRPHQKLRRDALMYLSRALNRSLAPPDWVSVNLTLQCNLKCVMCTTCYDVPDELSLAEIKGILDQVALWGVRIFNPLGGEPFMRGDLEEILAYAIQKDFAITLTTNGTLINRRRAEMLATLPPSALHLNVSIDGPEAVHDRIRGEGMFRRAMLGVERLRAADEAAGNDRRKILANAILHRQNVRDFPALLDALAERGFDGVQVLNLFRTGEQIPEESAGLWFTPEHLPALEETVAELRRRRLTQTDAGFRILNDPEELALIPGYYRDGVKPLDAPCWAGWKELYINSDGKAIMCDGQLHFLNGEIGDVRRQTLRQIWDSPTLKARREVVKRCTTPCVQSCYLRRDSDSARALGRVAWSLATDEVKRQLQKLRPGRGQRIDGGVLTLELSDVAPWPSPFDAASRARFDQFVAPCPAPITDCFEEPTRWGEYRDLGYLNFGRGFMGFEVLRSVLEDLRAARLTFPTLRLSWRGEPLTHPEIEPILRFVLHEIREHGTFERLELTTDARLLTPNLIQIIAEHGEIPQRYTLHGDGFAPHEDAVERNVQRLLDARGQATEVVVSWFVSEELDPYALIEPWRPRLRSPWLALGRPRPRGDGLWFRRTDPKGAAATAQARARLSELAEVLGAEAEPGDEPLPPRCPGPLATPTISWEGKITLCPSDATLQNRVGEVTTDRLSRLWTQDGALARLRQDVRARGTPDRPLCQGCLFVGSPNYQREGG